MFCSSSPNRLQWVCVCVYVWFLMPTNLPGSQALRQSNSQHVWAVSHHIWGDHCVGVCNHPHGCWCIQSCKLPWPNPLPSWSVGNGVGGSLVRRSKPTLLLKEYNILGQTSDSPCTPCMCVRVCVCVCEHSCKFRFSRWCVSHFGFSFRARIPYPLQWGAPTFDAGDAFGMMAASFAALIEVNYITNLLHMTFGREFVLLHTRHSMLGRFSGHAWR